MTTSSVQTPTSDSYQDSLIKSLADRQHAAAYLTAHLEEENPEPELLRLALCNVTEAIVNSKLSSAQIQDRLEQLDRILSQPGSDAIYELAQWLKPLGLQLTVTIASSEQ